MSRLSGLNTDRMRPALWALAAVGLILIGHLIIPNTFQSWNDRWQDFMIVLDYSWHGPKQKAIGIVHVDIGDSSYDRIGPSVQSRRNFARMIRSLAKAGAREVLLDVIFERAGDPEEDKELVEAAASVSTWLPVGFHLSREGSPLQPAEPLNTKWVWSGMSSAELDLPTSLHGYRNYPALENVVRGGGHISCPPDSDGVYRRMPLFIRYGEQLVPAMTLQVACKIRGIKVAHMNMEGGVLKLYAADSPEPALSLPVNSAGEMRIPYRGRWGDNFYHRSAAEVIAALEDDVLMDDLIDSVENAVVIIADTSAVGHDIGASPLETTLPLVAIHSTGLQAILKNEFRVDWYWDCGRVIYILAWLGCLLAFSFTRQSFFLGGALSLMLLEAGLSFYLSMKWGWVLNSASVMLSGLVVTGVATVVKYGQEQKEKDRIRRQFGSYIAPSVLEKILGKSDLNTMIAKKELTIMFTDICGFTAWCSQQNPQVIQQTLNQYFDEMSKIAFEFEATIDKFIGDGLMLFFGDPLDQPDHAERAVRCAIAMQQRIHALAKTWEHIDLKVRIGINTGEAAVGNLGSTRRREYTALGSTVNLAARLEHEAPVGGILINSSTFLRCPADFGCEKQPPLQVKGWAGDLETYTIAIK